MQKWFNIIKLCLNIDKASFIVFKTENRVIFHPSQIINSLMSHPQNFIDLFGWNIIFETSLTIYKQKSTVLCILYKASTILDETTLQFSFHTDYHCEGIDYHCEMWGNWFSLQIINNVSIIISVIYYLLCSDPVARAPQ